MSQLLLQETGRLACALVCAEQGRRPDSRPPLRARRPQRSPGLRGSGLAAGGPGSKPQRFQRRAIRPAEIPGAMAGRVQALELGRCRFLAGPARPAGSLSQGGARSAPAGGPGSLQLLAGSPQAAAVAAPKGCRRGRRDQLPSSCWQGAEDGRGTGRGLARAPSPRSK